MKLLRKDLLDALEVVAPALSANDLVPVMKNLWFTGTHVLAYNDQIGIQIPLKTDFAGAVEGRILIALLNNSRAKEVEFVPGTDDMVVKAARAKIRMGLKPVEEFSVVFKMPHEGNRPVLELEKFEDLTAAISNCMRSVGSDTATPDTLGITLMAADSGLNVYATNSHTLTHDTVKLKAPLGEGDRWILPQSFCTQLLRLAKRFEGSRLGLYDDHALYTSKSGVSLFGRLIESTSPVDFPAIFATHYNEGIAGDLIAIPPHLELVLDRAVIVAGGAIDPVKTSVTIKGGNVRFVTKSESVAEVVDTMKGLNHPDVDVKLDAKLLRAGCKDFDKFLITEGCAIMTNKSTVYLVSAKSA